MFKILKILLFYFKIFVRKFKLRFYSKEFSNYKDALEYSKSISKEVYNNEELNRFKFNKFINNKEKIPHVYNNSHKLLLEIICVYKYKENTFPKILDLGGQFGENKLYLDKLFDYNFTYDVVETKALVKFSNKIKHSKLFANLNDAIKLTKYDVLFTSCTIHYFEDPYEIIKNIFLTKIKYIALTRNNFSENPKIYSATTFIGDHGASEGHVKYEDKSSEKILSTPNTQINENKIKEIANNLNYNLIRELYGAEGNFGENSYSKDLIFVKK